MGEDDNGAAIDGSHQAPQATVRGGGQPRSPAPDRRSSGGNELGFGSCQAAVLARLLLPLPRPTNSVPALSSHTREQAASCAAVCSSPAPGRWRSLPVPAV
ncbi:hypothetical protein [Kitasatospora sp. NPDC017646]|uniref:hypothetical protein n=1 Tax=Kitasatospora sp. NPDC017646 TaxID=3364024 RepID=UPI0037BBA83D